VIRRRRLSGHECLAALFTHGTNVVEDFARDAVDVVLTDFLAEPVDRAHDILHVGVAVEVHVALDGLRLNVLHDDCNVLGVHRIGITARLAEAGLHDRRDRGDHVLAVGHAVPVDITHRQFRPVDRDEPVLEHERGVHIAHRGVAVLVREDHVRR
jgi:hypothetical protein